MFDWFQEAQGCRVEEPETGIVLTINDLRRVGREWYIGLTSEGGALKYVNLDRFDQLISVA